MGQSNCWKGAASPCIRCRDAGTIMIRKGFDVSSFQTDKIDFDKTIKAGMEFVIVRAGFGERISKTFAPQLEAALEAGIDAGAYWYSYAENELEAEAEAKTFLEALEPYKGKLTYPVWFDQEYEPQILALTRKTRTDICIAFMRMMESEGWYAGLYSSLDWLSNRVDGERLIPYDKWVAQYAPALQYTGEHGMWQYDGKGKLDGVPGQVDLDECYKDYPSIIRASGLNGFQAAPPCPKQEA